MTTPSSKKRTKKKMEDCFNDSFEGDAEFERACKEADEEMKSSGMLGAGKGNSPESETDEDVRKKWALGNDEESYASGLSNSMASLYEKLVGALDDVPKKNHKKVSKAAKKQICAEGEHYALEDTIYMLKTIGICFLTGPSGSGKSTLAKYACKKIFNLKDDPIVSGKYAQISFSPDTTSGEMIGRTDVHGNFNESEIVRVFRDGGLILFDEIDDADPSMLIKINTALANGYLSTPKGMIKKNKDTYIVCAANTFGTGPDAMYVGRTRLDAATLDRFCLCTIYVDYDKSLEDSIASQLEPDDHYWLTGYVEKIRNAIKNGKLRRTCSTRFVINATAHILAGKDQKWIVKNYLQGWTPSEKAKIEQEDKKLESKEIPGMSKYAR